MRIRASILIAAGQSLRLLGAGARRSRANCESTAISTPPSPARSQDALGHGAHAIRVTSGGGDPLASPGAGARHPPRQHATLIVDGLCAGACANFLFPAAGKTHGDAGRAGDLSRAPRRLALAHGAAGQSRARWHASYAPTALQEKSLIADAGVDQALLLEPLLRLELSCYSLTSKTCRENPMSITARIMWAGCRPAPISPMPASRPAASGPPRRHNSRRR